MAQQKAKEAQQKALVAQQEAEKEAQEFDESIHSCLFCDRFKLEGEYNRHRTRRATVCQESYSYGLDDESNFVNLKNPVLKIYSR